MIAEPTAEGLVTALLGVAGVRRITALPPLKAVVLVAHIEVAAIDPRVEASLRRSWRQRQGGGALPLLLIADDLVRQGCVVALGPTDPRGAARVIETDALYRILARIATVSSLEAVRELASELDRLDQRGIPGLRLRGLLTLPMVELHLRRDATRWAAAQEASARVPAGADWRATLSALGYQLERRPRVGYLLKMPDGRRVAVIHPKASPAEFSRLGADGRRPEGHLLPSTWRGVAMRFFSPTHASSPRAGRRTTGWLCSSQARSAPARWASIRTEGQTWPGFAQSSGRRSQIHHEMGAYPPPEWRISTILFPLCERRTMPV